MNSVSGALSSPVQNASPMGALSPAAPANVQQSQAPHGDTVSISAQGRQLAKGAADQDSDVDSTSA